MPILSTTYEDAATKRRHEIRLTGSTYLTDRELLATLLEHRRGMDELATADKLLDAAGSIKGLAKMAIPDLMHHTGISEVRATAVFAAIKFGVRVIEPTPLEPQRISDENCAAACMREMLHGQVQERLIVVLVDTKHQVMRKVEVYRGTLCAASVRVAEIVKVAVVGNAAHIVIGHNHPSMDPTPSPDDVQVTRKIVEGCNLMDIGVLDHIVWCDVSYVSMRQRGLVPSLVDQLR